MTPEVKQIQTYIRHAIDALYDALLPGSDIEFRNDIYKCIRKLEALHDSLHTASFE